MGPESTLLDRSLLSALFILALLCLARRSWLGTLLHNRWFVAFFVVAGLSISWSEIPFVAFKRYLRQLGHLAMILVIVTDPAPLEALRSLLRRSAYLLIPLSLILIRYYPAHGRRYSFWTGEITHAGVAFDKNGLAALCAFVGLFLIWEIRQGDRSQFIRYYDALVLALTLYLLWISNGATSQLCFLVGALFLLAPDSLPSRHLTNNVTRKFVVAVVLWLLADWAFGISWILLSSFDRAATILGRTELWADLIALNPNSLLGAGFQSFWSGVRARMIHESYWWQPNQAHNGYLETYLNLGWLGVSVLVGFLIRSLKEVERCLVYKETTGKLMLVYIMYIIFLNITDATFHGMHIAWFMLLLVVLYSAKCLESIGQTTKQQQEYLHEKIRRNEGEWAYSQHRIGNA